jgi:hypothetical protein
MTDEESKQRISQWQDRLHETFDHNGILGGKFLFPMMQLEGTVGELFIQKYHGHRLLTDAFLDFFGDTLQTQLLFHSQNSWPSNEQFYPLTFLMHLTMFRTVRATEVLSVKGYPLQGYALQRSIKDQVFTLWAIANNMMSFGELFGWKEAFTFGGTRDEILRKLAAKRMRAEHKIRSLIIGKESGYRKTHKPSYWVGTKCLTSRLIVVCSRCSIPLMRLLKASWTLSDQARWN